MGKLNFIQLLPVLDRRRRLIGWTVDELFPNWDKWVRFDWAA